MGKSYICGNKVGKTTEILNICVANVNKFTKKPKINLTIYAYYVKMGCR